MKLKPLKLKPVVKDYIWGGTALKELWGKTSDTDTIAECWEFSLFPGSSSEVDEALFKGFDLIKLYERYPEIFGKAAEKHKVFPILIKLIDACADLSVQVHPSDEYADKYESGSLGKSEIWYIADAQEGASIYYGFSRDVSREEAEKSIKENTITSLLRKIPVKKGEFYFVPAGTVHALLAGVTVIEIQENSNLTYRVYDYDRRDKAGNPRELHISKALDVMTLTASAPPLQDVPAKDIGGATIRKMIKTPYFTSKEVTVHGEYLVYNEESFVTFTVSEGEGEFEGGESFRKGETWLIPAGYMTKLVSGRAVLVVTTL